MSTEERLWQTYRRESTERLAAIERGLRELEGEPGDTARLQELFRQAHNMKGASRVIGLRDIQNLAHRLEDAFSAASERGTSLTREEMTETYEAFDELRDRVRERLAQAPGASSVEAPPERDAAAAPAATAARGAIEAFPGPLPSGEAAEAELVLDTVRVESAQLDALLGRAAELDAVRLRVANRVEELEAAHALAEAWAREAAREDGGGGAASARGEDGRRGSARERLLSVAQMLFDLRRAIGEDSSRIEGVTREMHGILRAVRLVRVGELFEALPRMVRALAKEQGKVVRVVVEGEDARADKRVLEELRDPIVHLVRNAVDHGIETPIERRAAGKSPVAVLRLKAARAANELVVSVSDDGRGLDAAAVKAKAVERGLLARREAAALSPEETHALVFRAGFTTAPEVTDVSGRGVGLDVVRASVERLKGTVSVETEPGRGATFVIRVPLSLFTTPLLLVDSGGHSYSIPVANVLATRLVPEDPASADGPRTIDFEGDAVAVVPLTALLGAPERAPADAGHEARPRGASRPCVLVAAGGERLGVLVDGIVDQEEAVVRPLRGVLERVRNVAGTTVLGSGDISTVLDADDLVRSARDLPPPAARGDARAASRRRPAVLLVEDSLVTRTYERRVLEEAGFDVVTAVDGLDALDKLAGRPFDAVVSDVQMPRMDGFALARRLRDDPRLEGLPIVLVTALESEAERRKGLEAGADAHVGKLSFDRLELIDTLRGLVAR